MVTTHPNKGVVVVVTEENNIRALGAEVTLFAYKVVGVSSMRGTVRGKQVTWRSSLDLKCKTGLKGTLSAGDLFLLCHPSKTL